MTNEGEYRDTLTYYANVDMLTAESTPTYTIDPKYWEYCPRRTGIITGITDWESGLKNNKKGDDDMRYLYEVILVNPKNDNFEFFHKVARSEVCALMYAYEGSKFNSIIAFDDLKTSCRVLMEWKKKESLKKAIETIKKAVE